MANKKMTCKLMTMFYAADVQMMTASQQQLLSTTKNFSSA